MMKSVHEDLQYLLVTTWVAQGLSLVNLSSATTDQWAIGRNKEAPSPDRMVTLYALPGGPPQRCTNISLPAYRTPSVSIRVRGRTEEEAGDKARAIQKVLEKAGPVSLPGRASGDAAMRYMSFEVLTEPEWLKMDEHDRHIWTFTVRVHRQEAS